MNRSMLKAAAAAGLAALALGAGTALASMMPPVQTHDGIQFVTGGIGESEASAMKAAQRQYPLALEFVQKAAPRDEYIADVLVQVTNTKGKRILTARSEGPYLYARLPDGEYTVVATYLGKPIRKRVNVTQHGSALAVFVWNPKH